LSLFKAQTNTTVNQRPTALVQLKFKNKLNEFLDPSDCYAAILEAFKNHPTLEVYQVEIRPSKDDKTSIV